MKPPLLPPASDREVLVVGFLEVLAAGDELEGGVPVELRLLAVFAVPGEVAGLGERLEGEVGVGEVGVGVGAAVADAAVVLGCRPRPSRPSRSAG